MIEACAKERERVATAWKEVPDLTEFYSFGKFFIDMLWSKFGNTRWRPNSESDSDAQSFSSVCSAVPKAHLPTLYQFLISFSNIWKVISFANNSTCQPKPFERSNPLASSVVTSNPNLPGASNFWTSRPSTASRTWTRHPMPILGFSRR